MIKVDQKEFETDIYRVKVSDGTVISEEIIPKAIFAQNKLETPDKLALFAIAVSYEFETGGRIFSTGLEEHPFRGASCLTSEEQSAAIPHINIHITKNGVELQNWHFGYLEKPTEKCIIAMEKRSHMPDTFCKKYCKGEKMEDVIRGVPYSADIPQKDLDKGLDKIINYYEQNNPNWLDFSIKVVLFGAVAYLVYNFLSCILTFWIYCPGA